jgi:hypothetical protein
MFYSRCVGQRRADREWPRPKVTRHVWVAQPDMHPPLQGFVLEWRRHAYRWSALVIIVAVDVEGHQTTTLEWLPAEQLTPVRSDPNTGRARRLI